jgi:predicted dinucleotide-binding enzyme
MKIGIVGVGTVGGTLARTWAAKGHELVLSYSRDAKKLEGAARALGAKARAGTPAEAARFGEVVVLATPWPSTQDALRQVGSLDGKILVDCVNPFAESLDRLDVGTTTSAAEEIARWAPGARVVKAFNTMGAGIMADPRFGAEAATGFVCGDDAAAKATVTALVKDTGLEVLDAGPLRVARYLEPMAGLWVHLALVQGLSPNIAFKLLRR